MLHPHFDLRHNYCCTDLCRVHELTYCSFIHQADDSLVGAVVSLYTLTREDFHDYETCPKIVSIKAYRELRAPPRERRQGTAGAPLHAITGRAAEAAFEIAFDEGKLKQRTAEEIEAERRRMERAILRRLAIYRKWIDGALREMIRETARGILAARRNFREAYGSLEILGHGESKNGIAPGIALLDFVAIRDDGKPIIVEVKNTTTGLKAADRFQAKYYNALSERYGVVVRTDYVRSGRLVLTPTQVRDVGAETLLVNARGGTYEVVRDRTDVSRERIKDIWAAKQLGLVGKTVSTACGPACPHTRYRMELPEASIEPSMPLPVAFGIGMVESGANLRSAYFHALVRQPALRVVWDQFRFARWDAIGLAGKSDEVTAFTAAKLGLDPSDLELALRSSRPDSKSLDRAATDQLRRWRRLVGAKRLKGAKARGKGLATRVFSLPQEPDRFVRDCERAWS